MMKKRHFFPLIVALLMVCASCATAQPPFASAEDTATKEKLIAALGEYSNTLVVTVSGGRVYYEGELQSRDDLMNAVGIAQGTSGVTSVMYGDVYLTDSGIFGDDRDYSGGFDWRR